MKRIGRGSNIEVKSMKRDKRNIEGRERKKLKVKEKMGRVEPECGKKEENVRKRKKKTEGNEEIFNNGTKRLTEREAWEERKQRGSKGRKGGIRQQEKREH